MQPTNVADPAYFHKVVDCQWACPAHTPVPEYIRLIAQGRYTDAYMVNWVSNVFPGILGRTCDRPCEPACRRGRVEENNARQARAGGHLPAEARGGRPQGRHHARACRTPRAAQRQAHRLRRRRAGLADGGARPGAAGLRRSRCSTARPRPAASCARRSRASACPRAVIDEETGYILDLGVDVPQRRAHRLDEGAAGRGLRRGVRRLRRAARARPRRCRAAARPRRTSTSASTGWPRCRSATSRASASACIVLGGGNTAMDCCRSARRLGASDVKVIVRSGFEEMKASPWEKEDAHARGHPDHQLPRAQGLRARGRQAGRHDASRSSRRCTTTRAGAASVPTGEPDVVLRLRRGAGRGRPGERLPVDRARQRHRVRRVGPAGARRGDASSRRCRTCSSAATRPSARRTSSPRWPTATRRRCRSTACCTARTSRERPPPHVQPDVAEDGHPRVELRQRVSQRPALQGAVGQGREGAGQHQGRGRARLRRRHRLQGGAALPELRRADGVHATSCASSATPASTSARWTASRFTANGDEADLRTRLKAPATQPDAGPVRRGAAEDRPRDGQGRGRLPALRPVRRALPDRRLGHAEVPARARRRPGPAAATADARRAAPRRRTA